MTAPSAPSPLLSVQDLRVSYPSAHPADGGWREVVHGVDLTVGRGERVAVVGESGSGKSVTARAVLRLDATARLAGAVHLSGPPGSAAEATELLSAGPKVLRSVRGARVGLVFQDPLAALNPVMPVGWQVVQPLVLRGVRRRAARALGVDLLARLGVRDAAARFDDYPHQFSGGMRQRVVIAIAVIAEPELLVADEPTTALDVRVQAQVLELLHELAEERGMAVVLITHDLGIVAGFAERVVVMRSGRVVEAGPVDAVYDLPQHPYTRALLGAVPRLDGDPSARLVTVPPDVPGDTRAAGAPAVPGAR